MQGWVLFKHAEWTQRARQARWQPAFLVLDPARGSLELFSTQPRHGIGEPSHTLDLTHAALYTARHSKYGDRYFELVPLADSTDGRRWSLAADSGRGREAWVAAIAEVLSVLERGCAPAAYVGRTEATRDRDGVASESLAGGSPYDSAPFYPDTTEEGSGADRDDGDGAPWMSVLPASDTTTAQRGVGTSEQADSVGSSPTHLEAGAGVSAGRSTWAAGPALQRDATWEGRYGSSGETNFGGQDEDFGGESRHGRMDGSSGEEDAAAEGESQRRPSAASSVAGPLLPFASALIFPSPAMVPKHQHASEEGPSPSRKVAAAAAGGVVRGTGMHAHPPSALSPGAQSVISSPHAVFRPTQAAAMSAHGSHEGFAEQQQQQQARQQRFTFSPAARDGVSATFASTPLPPSHTARASASPQHARLTPGSLVSAHAQSASLAVPPTPAAGVALSRARVLAPTGSPVSGLLLAAALGERRCMQDEDVASQWTVPANSAWLRAHVLRPDAVADLTTASSPADAAPHATFQKRASGAASEPSALLVLSSTAAPDVPPAAQNRCLQRGSINVDSGQVEHIGAPAWPRSPAASAGAEIPEHAETSTHSGTGTRGRLAGTGTGVVQDATSAPMLAAGGHDAPRAHLGSRADASSDVPSHAHPSSRAENAADPAVHSSVAPARPLADPDLTAAYEAEAEEAAAAAEAALPLVQAEYASADFRACMQEHGGLLSGLYAAFCDVQADGQAPDGAGDTDAASGSDGQAASALSCEALQGMLLASGLQSDAPAPPHAPMAPTGSAAELRLSSQHVLAVLSRLGLLPSPAAAAASVALAEAAGHASDPPAPLSYAQFLAALLMVSVVARETDGLCERSGEHLGSTGVGGAEDAAVAIPASSRSALRVVTEAFLLPLAEAIGL